MQCLLQQDNSKSESLVEIMIKTYMEGFQKGKNQNIVKTVGLLNKVKTEQSKDDAKTQK